MQDRFHRRSIRLHNYDYSQPGFYYVTICTQNHECWFGEIKNNEMIFNEIGQIAKQCWLEITKHYPSTNLDIFQIMPNHIHGIIEIESRAAVIRGDVIRDDVICDDVIRDAGIRDVGVQYIEPLRQTEHEPARQTESQQNEYQKIIPCSIGSIVRSYKAAVSRIAHNTIMDMVVWQRNYYEHIVRDEYDLERIRNYIRTNPIIWELDRNNPKFF